MSYSCRTGADQIEKEGIKALQLIQTLEGRGYRVKLNLYFCSRIYQEAQLLKITLKKPEERLSVSKLAFPIVHPSMLRRIGLRVIETNPLLTQRGFIDGYGTPAGHFCKELVEKNEIVIPNFLPEDIEKYINTLALK